MAQCRATAKATGKPCQRRAIAGATVCQVHGGAAPQVRRAARARLEASADRILEELCHISLVDIREAFDANGNLIEVSQLPDRVARSIAGIEFEDNWETDKEGNRVKVGRTAKIKLCDKLGGLDKFMRHHGLYAADRSESPNVGQVIQLVVVQAGAPTTDQPVLDIMSLVKH